MQSVQRNIPVVLVFVSVIYSAIFILPNNTRAKDRRMIILSEPDEFAQYPVVLQALSLRLSGPLNARLSGQVVRWASELPPHTT